MIKPHHTKVQPGEMPNMKKAALYWVAYLQSQLPQAQLEKLTRLLAEVPEIGTIVHGNYHVKNIMMQNGEVLLIDMDTLSCGNPTF